MLPTVFGAIAASIDATALGSATGTSFFSRAGVRVCLDEMTCPSGHPRQYEHEEQAQRLRDLHEGTSTTTPPPDYEYVAPEVRDGFAVLGHMGDALSPNGAINFRNED